MTKSVFILLIALAGALFPPAQARTATVYVISHGWHTGLVIRRGDIPDGLWPEHAQAPPGEYLEIGWGEREFYQTRNPSLLQALGAALWPSPSVLHLVGFNGPVRERFAYSDVIALPADTGAMARLANYIADAYERDAAGHIKRMGHGLYGDSRFFAGQENFHVFRTCNVWTARALRLAGCPVGAGITAASVMSAAARCGVPGR
ncbi:MAG: DUF2459 domain-containing protein [Alphaproteobacteria bacterium]